MPSPLLEVLNCAEGRRLRKEKVLDAPSETARLRLVLVTAVAATSTTASTESFESFLDLRLEDLLIIEGDGVLLVSLLCFTGVVRLLLTPNFDLRLVKMV